MSSCSVQFVGLDDIYTFSEARTRSTALSFRGSPNVAFETVSILVRLTMASSRRFQADRRPLPFPSLIQTIDGLMSFALRRRA